MSTYLSYGLFSALTCQFIAHLRPYPVLPYNLMRGATATDKYVYNEYSMQLISSLPYTLELLCALLIYLMHAIFPTHITATTKTPWL
jgi:hypothetical protein